MPGIPAPTTDERSNLLAFLQQQREGLKFAAYGLTDEQARLTPTAGALSVGGLIKHVAQTEQHWLDIVTQTHREALDRDDGFVLRDDQTLDEVIADYDAVAAETERIVARIDDLDHPVPVPQGVPWFPDDVEAWSLRWVLAHVIEETARHAGHADIVRESIDGATMYELMAGAEGWPETPWLTPWRPAAQTWSGQ